MEGREEGIGLQIYSLFFYFLFLAVRISIYRTFPNVIITPHQGFYTREALTAIAESTISSITEYARYARLLSFLKYFFYYFLFCVRMHGFC